MKISDEKLKRHFFSSNKKILRRKWRNERRQESRRRWKARRAPNPKPTYQKVEFTGGSARITAPETFNLLENKNEMLLFFAEFRKNVARRNEIFLDIQNISDLSAEAILSILSMLDYFKREFGRFIVKGNTPKDGRCRQLLIDSGFFNHVRSFESHSPSSNKILKIEYGTKAMGPIAKKALDFAFDNLKKSVSGKQYQSIYAVLIECMANTRNHAYHPDRHRKNEPMWHLMSLYDEQVQKVHFSFVDNGSGIPWTIRKKFHERLKDMFFSGSDGLLIKSALDGEFRTRTRLEHRGKGLPKILSEFREGNIQNLRVLSNKGYMDCTVENPVELSEKFQGSLLSWSFN